MSGGGGGGTPSILILLVISIFLENLSISQQTIHWHLIFTTYMYMYVPKLSIGFKGIRIAEFWE